MKKKNSKIVGLGSGLSSLLGADFDKTKAFSENKNFQNLRMIPIEFIKPGPWQPRKIFDKEEIEKLANSIKEQGIIQPIIIRSVANKENEYYIIAGERRWRASQIAKIHEIPSILRDDVEEDKIAELSLVENIQRSELNPIEEAEGYLSLINKYGYKQEKIAKVVGRSRSHISNMIRLLSLSDLAKGFLIRGELTIGQLRPLVGNSNSDHILETIRKNNLTSRQVEKLIKKTSIVCDNTKIIKTVDIKNLEKELKEYIGLDLDINFNDITKAGSIKIKCKNLSEFNYIIKKLKS